MNDDTPDRLRELLDEARRKLPLPKVSDEGCSHAAVTPVFDPVAARDLSDSEVRRRWPRFDGKCPTCQCLLISYASYEHYIMGDW
jgi:hypothetical protein